MSRELPFPVAFELPDGWTLVSPDDSGQADAAYVAVRDTNTADPVATNLATSGLGLHDAEVEVAALAAAQLANLQAQYAVTVLKCDVLTDGPTRQAAQLLLQIEYPVVDSTITLRQIRIVNAFRGVDDPTAVAVLALVMTCPADVFDQAGPEFGQFVASIAAAATPEEATRDDQVGEQISAAVDASRLDRQPGSCGV
jgi:hypothetical protein